MIRALLPSVALLASTVAGIVALAAVFGRLRGEDATGYVGGVRVLWYNIGVWVVMLAAGVLVLWLHGWDLRRRR